MALGIVAIHTGKSHWLVTDSRVVWVLCAIAVEGLINKTKSESNPIKNLVQFSDTLSENFLLVAIASVLVSILSVTINTSSKFYRERFALFFVIQGKLEESMLKIGMYCNWGE